MAVNYETSLLSFDMVDNNENWNNNMNNCGNNMLKKDNKVEAKNIDTCRSDKDMSREFLKQFLERSMIQNTKSSMKYLKPEGYHHLKKAGKLSFYQQQQSKPEQGTLFKRETDASMQESKLDNNEGRNFMRRSSFNMAITRKSVISVIENKDRNNFDKQDKPASNNFKEVHVYDATMLSSFDHIDSPMEIEFDKDLSSSTSSAGKKKQLRKKKSDSSSFEANDSVSRRSSLKRKPTVSPEPPENPSKNKLHHKSKKLLHSSSFLKSKGDSGNSTVWKKTESAQRSNLEKEKSRSLPLSVEHSVSGSHRYESVSKSKSSTGLLPDRPHHLDLKGKKKKRKYKLSNIFNLFRKRPVQETSRESLKSPLVPTKVMEAQPSVSTKRKEEDEAKRNGHLQYHHRGSHSFSPGDIRRDEEKSLVMEEFIDTLSRLSTRYARSNHSRSTTPGSRVATPEASFSSFKHQTSIKSEKSNSSSRHGSNEKLPTNSKYRTSNSSSVRNHRPISRRHTHHDYNNTSGLRNERHRVVRRPPPSWDMVDSHLVEEGSPTDTTPPVASIVADSIPFNDDVVDCGPSVGAPPSGSSVIERAVLFHNERSSMSTETSEISPRHLATDTVDTSEDSMNIDKLVEEISRCLRDQGDRYNDVVNTPDGIPLAPVLRRQTLRYLTNLTYSGFQDLAKRFWNTVQPQLEPTSQPDVFPFMVVFNMTRFIFNLAHSDAAADAAGRIIDYSSHFIADMVEGTSTGWDDLVERFQEAEVELIQAESFVESPLEPNHFDGVD